MPLPTTGLVLTAVAATTGFTLSLGACSTTGSPSSEVSDLPTPPPSSAPRTNTTVSPADTASRKATAAYLGMWKDVAAATTSSDWKSPRLSVHATGDALMVLSRQLYADHYNGLVTRGRPISHPVVQSVKPPDAPTAVLIRDCADARNWLKYRADNGKPVDDEPGGKHVINAEVKQGVDGAWRVSRFAIAGSGSC